MDNRNTTGRAALSRFAAWVKSALSGKADLSDLTGYAMKTWVEGKGYQTAAQVQSAIAAIPDELPTVSSTDNGKFLRVVNGAWAAQTVPSAESNSFGGGA